MQLTIKTVLYSAVLHIAVLYLFTSQNHIMLPQPVTPALKTYLVIETNNKPFHKEQTNNLKPSKSLKKNVSPNSAETRLSSTSLKPMSRSQSNASHTTTKPFTKPTINPREFLQHVKAQSLSYTTPLSSGPQDKKNQRTITHSLNMLNKHPKIISKNHTFTEYQHNNTCYKVFTGDINNRVADPGLTTQWQSLPYTCNNTKMTLAYDKVMNKWLNKKR